MARKQPDARALKDSPRIFTMPRAANFSDFGMETRPQHGSSVGVIADTAADVVRVLEEGLSFEAIEKLRDALGITNEQVAELTRIPIRTFARRKQEGKFDLDESERVLRLATVYERALSLFESDRDAARRWLQTPRVAFGRKSVLEFAETEVGAREVDDLIERIEYGVIS